MQDVTQTAAHASSCADRDVLSVQVSDATPLKAAIARVLAKDATASPETEAERLVRERVTGERSNSYWCVKWLGGDRMVHRRAVLGAMLHAWQSAVFHMSAAGGLFVLVLGNVLLQVSEALLGVLLGLLALAGQEGGASRRAGACRDTKAQKKIAERFEEVPVAPEGWNVGAVEPQRKGCAPGFPFHAMSRPRVSGHVSLVCQEDPLAMALAHFGQYHAKRCRFSANDLAAAQRCTT